MDLFQLLQLGVLRLGFFQDGDVWVGVFPEGEELRLLMCSGGVPQENDVAVSVTLVQE
jgi:hypothetical protein